MSARTITLVFAGLTGITAPAAAQASPVVLTTDIEAVRTSTDAAGKSSEHFAKPDVVTPGDRLRFTIHYRNTGTAPAHRFVVNNPLPEQVTLDRIVDDADVTVSVDGGATYGVLASLAVAAQDGSQRPATLADVTHLRWTIATVAPGTTGVRRFFARVK